MTARAPPRGGGAAPREKTLPGAQPPYPERHGVGQPMPRNQSRASCAAKRREGAQGVLRVAETEAATVGGGLSSPGREIVRQPISG